MIWALDLDGVVWRGKEAVPGSTKAIANLQDSGHEVIFVTNNSYSTIADSEQKLAGFGIDGAGQVVSSAQAAASTVEAGQTVHVLGGPGVREAVLARGGELVADEPTPDVVIVGLDWELEYSKLALAATHIRNGSRFVGTNADPSFPSTNGLLPGAGSIIAAVAAASGVEPRFAGKPHSPIATLVRSRFGGEGIMVGDRPETDGLFAVELGYPFALVLSGVTTASDLPVSPSPKYVADDLASLVDQII